MSAIFWKLFNFILVCFCVLVVSNETFARHYPGSNMGELGSLLVAVIISVFLIIPEVVRLIKHGQYNRSYKQNIKESTRARKGTGPGS